MTDSDAKDGEVLACVHPSVFSSPLTQRPFEALLGGTQKLPKKGDKNVDEGHNPLHVVSAGGQTPPEGTIMSKFGIQGSNVVLMSEQGEGGGGGQTQTFTAQQTHAQGRPFDARKVHDRMDGLSQANQAAQAQAAQAQATAAQAVQATARIEGFMSGIAEQNLLLSKQVQQMQQLLQQQVAQPQAAQQQPAPAAPAMSAADAAALQAIAAIQADITRMRQAVEDESRNVRSDVSRQVDKKAEDWFDKVKTTTMGNMSFSEDGTRPFVRGFSTTLGVGAAVVVMGVGANMLGVKFPGT